MKVTILGCSGTFPGPDSGCSSYLVEHEGFRLLLDAGNGSIGALQRHAPLLGVDAVFLTHLHADHCVDLVAYYYARRYHPEGQPPPLPLYGPQATGSRLVAMLGHHPADLIGPTYDLVPTDSGCPGIGPFDVELARTNHPIECHAIRLSVGGRSFVYSGDSGECPELVELADGADTLLIEASWYDEDPVPPGVHLTARQAGEHAARAQVGRTLLTHVVPWGSRDRTLEEASQGHGHGFRGPLEIARPDATYEI
jgi:ribonuclease BN (tRNA processing enzyme)